MSVPSQPIITNKYPFTLSDRVELYWQAPLSNGGNAITSYIVECPNIPYIEILSNTESKTTISNLTIGSEYLFSVKATNINGNSNPAFYNLVQTGFKPSPPTNLQFTSNIDNYSKLQFTFDETSNIGSSNILYNVVTMVPIDISGNILEYSSFKFYNSTKSSNILNSVVLERTNTNFDYKAHVRARNSINFSDKGFSEFVINPNLPSNGLKLWLDPYDMTTLTLSNSKVIRWLDKSKSRANATISETFAPTYDSNIDVLVFTGNQYLNLPANTLPDGNTSYTIFTYVSTSNISRNGQWFLNSGTPESNLSLGGLINGNLITHSWFNNNLISNSNINSSLSYLLEMNYTNGLRKTLINGNLVAQDFVGFRNSTSGNNIIGSNSTLNGNLVGTIGDIIVYDRLLNDIERRSVRNYLERKKLTISLQSLGNLVVWLDPSDNNTLYDNNIKFKTAYNNNVFSWIDKSGLNNNARQSNVSLAPIKKSLIQNNLDVLEFNQSCLTIPTAYYPLDAYIILKLNNLSETYGILGVGPNSNNYSSLSYNTSGGNLWSINNTSNSIISGSAETSGNFLLMEWSISGNSNVIRRYGSNISNVTTGTFTLPTNSNIIIGNNNTFDLSKRFKGYIGEIIIFNKQLIVNDRQQIEGYLAWKWGLQTFLASDHPYKNSAPINIVSNTRLYNLIRSKNKITTDGLQVGYNINKDMTTVGYYGWASNYFPNMSTPSDSTIVQGDKNAGDRTNVSLWNDWGDDVFDGWGNFYLYDVETQKYYYPLFNPRNQSDGLLFTQTFNVFGRTFTITHGYPVLGIFKFDISVNDDKQFRFGFYGNMGFDSSQYFADYAFPYTLNGNNMTLYYHHNMHGGNEQLWHYFIPKKYSENLTRTYNYVYVGDNNSIMSPPVTSGLLIYLAKTYDTKLWVINDLE